MAGRFIKLYDKILNWEWYHDINTFRLFIHLLLKANYKDAMFQGIVIKRGQLVTSLTSIAAGTGLSVRQARVSLDKLKMTGEVTSTLYPKFRVITIVRYDDYQSSDKQNDRQMTSNASPKRQANDKQNDKQRVTQTSSGMTTSIEYIEDIEDRIIDSPTEREVTAKRFTPPTLGQVIDFCRSEGIELDAERFIAYYESNGWMVGRNKMKSWQAAARNWAKRDSREQRPAEAKPKQRTVVAQDYPQRDYKAVQDDLMDEQRRHILERLGRK